MGGAQKKNTFVIYTQITKYIITPTLSKYKNAKKLFEQLQIEADKAIQELYPNEPTTKEQYKEKVVKITYFVQFSDNALKTF